MASSIRVFPPPRRAQLYNQREMGQIIATLNKAKLMLPARPSTGDFLSVDGRQREVPDLAENPHAATSSLETTGKSLPFSEP